LNDESQTEQESLKVDKMSLKEQVPDIKGKILEMWQKLGQISVGIFEIIEKIVNISYISSMIKNIISARKFQKIKRFFEK
jgi:hypothetical protein